MGAGQLMDIDWRDEANAPKPGTRVCVLDDLVSGEVKEFVFGADDSFRMIVYRKNEALAAYVNQCPHQWLAMNRRPGTFLFWGEDELMCAHHSSVFRLLYGGHCIMGPCQGARLTRIPLQVTDGEVRIADDG
jgi:nitrite reductase/ring-hydroxylating ferredoxin subunit